MVITPFAALTGLLYYFGWVRTGAVFSYFGIDQRVLGYSSQDYIVRSAGIAFRPAAVLVLIGVLALIAFRVFALAVERAQILAVALAGVATIGLLGISVAVLFGLASIVSPMTGALGLVLGALTAELASSRMWPHVSSTWTALRRILVVATITIGCFWGCAVYAQQAGEQLAQSWAYYPHSRPGAIIYSTEDLRLSNACITVLQLKGGDSGYRFRYSGLRVLVYSNQRWFLIPDCWRPDGLSSAVILSDDSKIRVEVTAPH